MPADFDQCVADGGKVRTKTIDNSRYLRICFDGKGGSHAGEVKKKKSKGAKGPKGNFAQNLMNG